MATTTDLVNRYEKGMIYKLCCKDANTTEIYIGSTVNKYRRKGNHKHICSNPNHRSYNLYVYQFIRENGGFDNWDLVILEEYSTQNKGELVWKEREWIELLKPALNSVKRPAITTEECRERKKTYYEENTEQIRKHQKEYREENTEKCREKDRKQYEKNKQKIREKYEKNKQKISERNKERVNCDICNKEFARASLTKHKKRVHKN